MLTALQVAFKIYGFSYADFFEFDRIAFTFALLKNYFWDFYFRDVAQPGSAHVWGAWGRKFESCHPDKLNLCIYRDFFMPHIVYKLKAAKG